ncbi:MAG: YidC/Oxa1 family membrane protein insertase [Anaerolineae bacterium]|nr:YidC/Oxa1 family membrane protein insertase [Anaerolineae bacterium]
MWDVLIIQPLVNILMLIYSYAWQNFGIAIILFTLLIRLITHPLNVQQIKGAAAMQDLQKDKRYIEMQAKYKNDKEALAQEQMKLYKELGINPLASCLPTLIQFPIIIGLYQSIIKALAASPLDLLSLVRFINPSLLNVATVIPLNSKFLWMDLGQPERLFIPGIPWGIPVLTVLVVITTYLQSKLMSPPSAAGAEDQTAAMTGMMNIYMPLLMGWLTYSYASGLAVYFITTNVISIGQYAIMGRLNWDNLLPKNLLPKNFLPGLLGADDKSSSSKSTASKNKKK